MAKLHAGRQSLIFPDPPILSCWASAAGKKEAQGPLGHTYDVTSINPYWGEKTWEQAEQKMQVLTLEALFRKARISSDQVDLIFSGDLLNQCVASSFALRNAEIPHLGLYGACSTMAEGLVLASMAVSSGFADRAVAMTSSHFAASERQYRFPLGYGCQRTPTSQWTVTGSGAVLVTPEGKGPSVIAATVGTVADLGITDAGNMGGAMVPAAYETMRAHFDDLKTGPEDYTHIVTGDLGQIGRELLLELALRDGIHLEDRLLDCGCMVYDNTSQHVHSGGSGCGCSAIVLCGELLPRLGPGESLLFCGTGALLSPVTTQQKLPIPAICHAVAIRGRN